MNLELEGNHYDDSAILQDIQDPLQVCNLFHHLCQSRQCRMLMCDISVTIRNQIKVVYLSDLDHKDSEKNNSYYQSQY